jgi:hypothetical protein
MQVKENSPLLSGQDASKLGSVSRLGSLPSSRDCAIIVGFS